MKPRKAEWIPLDRKKEAQVLEDISMTPQERVDRMFDLIDLMLSLQKEYIDIPPKNSITLKRRSGGSLS